MQQYSFARFTKPGDRLLGLSSVARAVKPFLGATWYLASLWGHDLVEMVDKIINPASMRKKIGSVSEGKLKIKSTIEIQMFPRRKGMLIGM